MLKLIFFFSFKVGGLFEQRKSGREWKSIRLQRLCQNTKARKQRGRLISFNFFFIISSFNNKKKIFYSFKNKYQPNF